MERKKGKKDTPILEKIGNTYYVRWDYKEESEEEVTYNEIHFPFKPTINIIQDTILGIENSKIDNKILSGFIWNNMSVWLSSENQFNYKVAYDLSVQTNGANLPITFKFGDKENPVYHVFSTVEELTDFYTKAVNYVNETLKEGWTEKDLIPWKDYEELL